MAKKTLDTRQKRQRAVAVWVVVVLAVVLLVAFGPKKHGSAPSGGNGFKVTNVGSSNSGNSSSDNSSDDGRDGGGGDGGGDGGE
jgi:hypothetical protein